MRFYLILGGIISSSMALYVWHYKPLIEFESREKILTHMLTEAEVNHTIETDKLKNEIFEEVQIERKKQLKKEVPDANTEYNYSIGTHIISI